MHDPAWWWVKASNLGTLSGVAVRFSLAHEIVAAGLGYGRLYIGIGRNW